MRRSLRFLACAPLFAACAGAPPTATTEALAAAVPRASWVHMEVQPQQPPQNPNGKAQAQPNGPQENAHAVCALLGPSSMGTLTRQVSHDANGLVENVLQLVATITQGPPSQEGDGQATWFLDDGKSPVVHAFAIQAVAPDTFNFFLGAKPRGADDNAWQGLLGGEVNTADPSGPVGNLAINFGMIHNFDPNAEPETGGAAVQFGRSGDARVVAMHLGGISGKGAPPDDADYQFAEHADGSGGFGFATRADFDHDGTLDELLHVQSAWQSNGLGQSHATVTGGSLGNRTVDAVECWTPSLARVFYADDIGTPPTGNPLCCPQAPAQ